MFSLFKKPAPAPQPVEQIDTVTLAYHRSVLAARGEASAKEERRLKDRIVELWQGKQLAKRQRDAAYACLRAIVEMQTANGASIGRKMAATARAGLPEFADGEREAA